MGYSQTSKSKSFTKGPRLVYNCRGSYCCSNAKSANIADFGINRLEFQQKEGVMICALCGEKAAYLPCGGRLILDKDTEKKIITAKHYGTHSYPIEVKGCNKDVSKIAKEFPRLTRESIVRQKRDSTSTNYHFLLLLQLQKTIPTKHILIISRENKRQRGDQTGIVTRL